jgi:hypothetical protein
MANTPVNVQDPQWLTWRETAVRQGILCLVCSEVPSLEHREAFYDTGLCEICSRELLSKEAAAPAA